MRRKVTVIVDRPKGYIDQYGNKYPINYGYIPGIIAQDGEEQDAYIMGVEYPINMFKGKVIAIIHRLNDVEDKWVVSNVEDITEESIRMETLFLEKYFNVWIEML